MFNRKHSKVYNNVHCDPLLCYESRQQFYRALIKMHDHHITLEKLLRNICSTERCNIWKEWQISQGTSINTEKNISFYLLQWYLAQKSCGYRAFTAFPSSWEISLLFPCPGHIQGNLSEAEGGAAVNTTTHSQYPLPTIWDVQMNLFTSGTSWEGIGYFPPDWSSGKRGNCYAGWVNAPCLRPALLFQLSLDGCCLRWGAIP